MLFMATQWIKRRLDELERSQADLARALGLDASAISRMIKGERQIKADELPKIARVLDLAPDALMHRLNEQEETGNDGGRYVADAHGPIPVYSGAEAGEDDDLVFDVGGPVETVPRPPVLEGVRGAFAVWCQGSSMEPKYEPGQRLYVHPHKPLRKNCFVVVRKKSGKGLIKQFLGFEGERLMLRQLSPKPATFALARAEVDGVWRIVHADEV
ncbi:MAG: helix-turn-helix transcriptional regulator [Proteobacteria bacterium]|nr:helix-turn-helix transcriptional regulator [Pseudomonadota bacterium]